MAGFFEVHSTVTPESSSGLKFEPQKTNQKQTVLGLRQISLAFRQATKLQYPQSKELREGVRVLGLVGGGLANVFERPMRQLY